LIKRYIIPILFIVVLTFTGCSNSTSSTQVNSVVEVADAQQTETAQEVEKYRPTDDDFKKFFTKYFSLSEDDILAINQRPDKVTPEYWEAYTQYEQKVVSLIGSYLTDDAKRIIKEQHLHYGFDLPKKIQLHGYVTYDPTVIEKAEILSFRPLGDNMIYEIALTTRNKVIDVFEANRRYRWDYNKGYYVRSADNASSNTFSIPNYLSKYTSSSYLLLQETPEDHEDEIRLIQKYWVEVAPDDSLMIEGVKEASVLEVEEQSTHVANNTKYITRIPYTDGVPPKDDLLVKTVFLKLFSQTQDFYYYYEKALNQDLETFKAVWDKSLALSTKVIIPQVTYKQAYSNINPYKDNIVKLEVKEENIVVKPSLYSTQKQPRYLVYIPVKALLSNNEVMYYEYKYLTGLELGSVEFITYQDVSVKDETWYNSMDKSQQVEEETSEEAVAQ
jgi:hypothetical protein